MAYRHPPKEPIAIIGAGCRFPGDATSPSKLWELLRAPRDLTKTVPSESRFSVEGFYHPNGEHHGCSNVTKSYFIEEDPRLFDCGFFSIAPREAEAIDPQQRVLLETVYEAMENAGLTLHGLRGSQTSAYVGAMSADYTDTQTRDLEDMSQYMITGTSRALLANRLSYFFDWHGPSIAVDTACSSSLAAVHLGVQSLRGGECTMSCVAGSNLILGPEPYLSATSLHLLSPSGRSQMWDQGADGYARGEGVCAFFLKTLSQALKDGDRIDALIRETCVNSDGRTVGIALPSAEAQAALISTAYRNAGLDVLRAEDRPQYIEAHGTGTQAGDPREASALSQVFFPPGCDHDDRPSLLVGSVKTIIGHTEGTAGVAGMLKTLLSMQNNTIPPNQHLHNLNRSVRPFYEKLRIPTDPQEWPPVPPGQPLRASVNGFGSGGTNCHAIMESYVPEVHDHGPWGWKDSLARARPKAAAALPDDVGVGFTPAPMVFSAVSEPALVAMLERYSHYLETASSDLSMQRLAATLHTHRSTLPVRIAFPAVSSRQDLLEAIGTQLSRVRASPGTEIGTRPPAIELDETRRPRILGIFTGQGAQWPGMGQSLMRRCVLFRETMELMEASLAALPDPPAWSLTDELMAPPATSRMSDAELSLPLCAAVQVGLCRVLARAGITFHTVVGHSGGEIGAAYAAGRISESDAVRIAYYRGIVCKLAVGADGRRGAMIAVGFGYQEGLDFCSAANVRGRLEVAASNSPKSVTLSGDEDAVLEARQVLDERGLFNRVLKVDTGYHSHHMAPCAEPYTAQLKKYDIQPRPGNAATAWVSSVYEDSRTMTSENDLDLRAEYWTDNLVGRVLFSQALERALDVGRGSLDLALEVGPHPALRGPSLDTMRAQWGYEIPYSGVLDRKADDISALSAALGLVWTHLGPKCVDFSGHDSMFSTDSIDRTPLSDLPTYPWDHKQVLYRESRLNKKVRSRAERPHELLGKRTPDDADYEPRWRNIFKLDEIPWLRDHCIQGQVVLPAAAYVVMALEAARIISRGRNVESIELADIAIMRPIVLDESSGGTETLLSLRTSLDAGKVEKDAILADFSLSASTVEDKHLRTAATGQIRISLADDRPEEDAASFPARPAESPAGLLPVHVGQFYSALHDVGLSYTGPFRAITSAARRLDMASATVAIDGEVAGSMSVHPTWLDACFQTFLAAFAAPRDGSLWTAFMPTTIGRMTFSPAPPPPSGARSAVIVDASLTEFTPGYQATLPTINGDMSIYDSNSGRLAVRVEDFTMSSFQPATVKDDRLLYLKAVWQPDLVPGLPLAREEPVASPPGLEVIDACEKAIRYYLLKLKADESFRETIERNQDVRSLMEAAAARDAAEPMTAARLDTLLGEHGSQIDMLLVKTIGEALLNKPQQHELPDPDGAAPSMGQLITRWHDEGLGFSQVHEHMISAARLISHRHQNLRVLQVGPSAAQLVRSVCQELGNNMISYTIVDELQERLDEMQVHLGADHLRVAFKRLDVERDDGLLDDAAGPNTYDVVLVHKAFGYQARALKNLRRLVRPGGYLLMMAATGGQLRFPFFLLSTLSAARYETAQDQPRLTNATHEETHGLLQDAGFSGVDCMALDNAPDKHTFSVVVSQAVDNDVRFLRSPLTSKPAVATDGMLLIVGGTSPEVANFAGIVRERLSSVWTGIVTTVPSLLELHRHSPDQAQAVLSLADLDHSVLEDLTSTTWEALKVLLNTSKTVLWVTQDGRSANPYQSATLGLGRAFQSENPHKTLQFLDLDTLDRRQSLVAESFLRLAAGVAMRDDPARTLPLWSIEPELVAEQGKILIPRLYHDKARNDRYNCLRRRVENEVLIEDEPVTLTRSLRSGGEPVFVAETAFQHHPGLAASAADNDEELIPLRVEYCSADPVIPNHCGRHLFCCLGLSSKDGARFLALSDSNSSFVRVRRAWSVKVDNEEEAATAILSRFLRMLTEIKSRVIEQSMPPGRITLLYDLDAELCNAVEALARKSNKTLSVLVNSQTQRSVENGLHGNHIRVGVRSSTRELKSTIPPSTRLLIHAGHERSELVFNAVRKALPANAVAVTFNDLDVDGLDPREILSEGWASLRRSAPSTTLSPSKARVVKASALVSEAQEAHADAVVIDWTGGQSVTLTHRPQNPAVLLCPNKTYVLVGLTGHLGQSICRWMVTNGARHIVVTSRNPDKNASWTEELQAKGARIAIEAADVGSKQDVEDLRRRILSTMPPIGGVANGAMVMANSLFADMTYEQFQMSMQPKARGSLVLDQVFSADELDFFLMFSSISAVTGQRGQANYAASNNFMVGLASNRRARNLPASVVDIGMIIGIGFIQRTDEDTGAMEATLRDLDYMPVSERDLYHILAEGIRVGRIPDESPEVITGLTTRKAAKGSGPFWHSSLLFSNLIQDASSLERGASPGDNVQKTLQERLAGAPGPDAALRIMEDALLAYLGASLKLSVESIYTDVPIIDLGVDSLVAVEIRNWVFSEAGHDIPVLKILGGSSIRQICSEVVSALSFGDGPAPSPEASARAAPPTDAPLQDSQSAESASSTGEGSQDSPPGHTTSSRTSPGPVPSSDSVADDQLGKALGPVDDALDLAEVKPTRLAVSRREALSLGQSRLYFLCRYLEDDTALNCTASYELLGRLDVRRLERALEAVVQRHEALRTVFFDDQGKPMQGVLEKPAFRLNVLSGVADEPAVKEAFDRTRRHHFDLETGHTFVATLLSHSADRHTIVFGYHHIIMDGVSWQNVLRDLSSLYDGPDPVPSFAAAAPSQYIEFTRKQQRDLADGAYAERLKFFQDEFRDPVDPLPLFPFARVSTRKSLTEYATRDVVTHISAETLDAVRKTSQASRTTVFHFLLATFQVLLHRLLDDVDQMCIGVVDANRSDRDFSGAVGFFLETLPLLFRVSGEQPFSEVLQATRNKAYAALAQTGVPTEEVLRVCNFPASTTETPLFQVVFNYRMGASRAAPMQGVDVKFKEYADAKNPFDLVISADELEDGTGMLTFSAQGYLYDQEGMEVIASTYAHLLKVLSEDATVRIGDVSVFDAALAPQAIAAGIGSVEEKKFSTPGTLSKGIDVWVKKRPEDLAVRDLSGRAMTYAQLSERASAISTALSGGAAPSSSSVCTLLEPGVDTIATILAILRSGAAYVPLDTRGTDERLADILGESGSAVLLHDAKTADQAKGLLKQRPELARRVRQISVDDMTAAPGRQPVEDMSTPEGLAMILYTSGSTGKPKGIPLTHANVLTTILGVSQTIPLGREVVLQQSGQGFDAAIFQIFIALANGGVVIMADNRKHPGETAALMRREGVTCSVFVASEMQAMLKYGLDELAECTSWRIAMVAGETFTTNLLDHFRRLQRRDLRVLNAYGPTETSICSSLHEISPYDTNLGDSIIPIGKALPNYATHIVDDSCRPVPIGWPGQIAISGPGVARGYLGLPDLTKSKFRHQALSGRTEPGWDMLYLTGDKGRMLSDGSIIMSGRVDGDGQVKIRGLRVQLDDVARALVQSSRGGLVDAVVLLRDGEEQNSQRLVAYAVFSQTSQVEDKDAYLRLLARELPIPPYMRPGLTVALDSLPVTERGKLDHRRLAAMPLPEPSWDDDTNQQQQLTEHEIRLRDVWRGVLGDTVSKSIPIRRRSDFFSIGGHSLLLLQLQAEIRRVFGVAMALPELFQASTLELMAARLAGDSKLDTVDWEKETQLDESAFPSSLGSWNGRERSARRSEGISVLLTGATGFLGTAILQQLVQLPRVARVHCAAVRPGAGGTPRELLVDSPKVVYHAGNLALAHLGMSEPQLDELMGDIDVIIHNGAEVSHMKSYRSLRATNFLSAVELARLAVRAGVPMHYVSTGGVARLSGAEVQPESSLAAFKPPADGSDGYVASKWASEVFLEKVARRFQERVWIHRPSSITADNVPALDVVHSVLRYSRLMKAVPDLTGSTGAFDFVHLDTVSKEIARSAVISAVQEEGAVRGSNHAVTFVHHSGEEVVPVSHLKLYLEGSAVGSFRVARLEEWVEGALAKGMDQVLGSFMLASKGVIRVPILQKGYAGS